MNTAVKENLFVLSAAVCVAAVGATGVAAGGVNHGVDRGVTLWQSRYSC